MLKSVWESPVEWQTLTLSSGNTLIDVPGLVKIDASGRERKIAVNQSPQVAGAYYVAQGVAPSTVQITVRLWTRQQYSDYVANVMPVVEPQLVKSTGLAQYALEVINAQLNQSGINRIIIHKVSPLTPSGPGGELQSVWQCTEYAPAKPVQPYKVGTPATSTGGVSGGVATSPSSTAVPGGG